MAHPEAGSEAQRMTFVEQKLREIRRRRRWEAVGNALLILVYVLDTFFAAIGGWTVGGWLHAP
jgi:hypothetical protein